MFNTEREPFFVDSGFIVFNKVNYPNFTNWIRELNVKESQSEMSLVFPGGGNFEWGGGSVFSAFGQRIWPRQSSSKCCWKLLNSIS